MNKRGGLLIAGGVALFLVGRLLGWWGGPQHPARVHNQIWIEREPRHERDLIRHLVLLEDEDQRFGAAGCSSAWRLAIDLVRWQPRGSGVRIEYPQERKHADFHTRVWHCAGEAPKPFELCLELERRGRKVRYYSREEWIIDDHGKLPAGIPSHVASSIGAIDAATMGAAEGTDDLEDASAFRCALD